MSDHLDTCQPATYEFVHSLMDEIKYILVDNLIGLYLHGSLAMGGFNPANSDIDLLGVTKVPLANEDALKLKKLLLKCSNQPFPIEISFLNKKQLREWQHPSHFDFHFSEFWRSYFENQSQTGAEVYLYDGDRKDKDLAAHITITNYRGICLLGNPIIDVFPRIPREHYISSILGDFQSCLQNIEQDPVYCTLNLLRVYRYFKEHEISSKLEGGEWGLSHLPNEYKIIIRKVISHYQNHKYNEPFEAHELLSIKDYVKEKVEEIVGYDFQE
ncbi:aminoglycoside adenylyltransferase domain-containing protein [Halobacillus amylolyticus]|uniref:Spectinomycin 9-adenylyltransferase n=1 Tax=Halobacillus amylolyticus TaxID=2932259 RepID=A0ABY4HDN4_9BACI|nr:aminoglycoside adenylyltransferase domain-containing protein [Halobacillus amylolyticus]UOR12676.1 DUF4111 domain-containing protein [Halobacillus amylolyticus]